MIAAKLKQLRKHKGWTQEQTAAKLKISKRFYIEWETGRQKPTYEQLIKMTKLFNYDFTIFVYDGSARLKKVMDRIHALENELKEIKQLLKNG